MSELATCNLHSPNRHNLPSKTCLSEWDTNRHDRYAAVTGHKLHQNNSTETSRRQRRFASLLLVANPLCFDTKTVCVVNFGLRFCIFRHKQTVNHIQANITWFHTENHDSEQKGADLAITQLSFYSCTFIACAG